MKLKLLNLSPFAVTYQLKYSTINKMTNQVFKSDYERMKKKKMKDK